ncbi:hypothetical protein Pelo_14345 [Pelomyxa schiedti]|nr:hypothetical protein Pelo_14345 [Pelomyxa schiedti]
MATFFSSLFGSSAHPVGLPSVVTVRTHPHPLVRNYDDNGWACDARGLPGGCRSGVKDFNQTKGMPRWRCVPCDYDLCDRDVAAMMVVPPGPALASASALAADPAAAPPPPIILPLAKTLGTVVCVQHHPHPLVYLGTSRNNGWGCDGRKLPGGCKRARSRGPGGNTSGLPRWRCRRCDFDLCDMCADALRLRDMPHRLAAVSVHDHALLNVVNDNGWACDARALPRGCARGITAFRQTGGMERWRCDECDFDLCDLDMRAYLLQYWDPETGSSSPFDPVAKTPTPTPLYPPSPTPTYPTLPPTPIFSPAFPTLPPAVTPTPTPTPTTPPPTPTPTTPTQVPPNPTSPVSQSDECAVCMEHERNAVFVPCAHLVCCFECASIMKTCPTCRGPISSVLKIYKS